MKEILFQLLQAVIIAAVPIITGYICTFISKKGSEIDKKIENDEASKLLNDALDAVCTAVISTNQTYVDALKRSGTFTVENQKEAFKKSYETAVSIMTKEAQEFIELAYGSLNDWLTTQIEASVNVNKTQMTDEKT